MEQSLNNNQQTNQSINNQNNQTMEQTTTTTTTDVMVTEFVSCIEATQSKWIHKVDESLGSLFTKVDVKEIIKQHNQELLNQFTNYFAEVVQSLRDAVELSKEVVPALPEDIAQRLKDKLQDIVLFAMEDMYMKDYIEVTDESFEIDYKNQVCLDSYELDGDVNGIARHIAKEIEPEIVALLTEPQVQDC